MGPAIDAFQDIRKRTIEGRQRPIGIEPRTVAPVKWWATLGALFVATSGYLWIRWFTGSDFRPTPAGPSPIPHYMKVGVVVFTVIGFTFTIWAVYTLLVKPWHRDRHVSLDGLFILAFISMAWQDALPNYFRPFFIYNSWQLNFGSWYQYIPGWVSPNGNRMATPILFDWPTYVYFWAPMVVFGGFIMRRARARWPQMGRCGLAGCLFGIFLILDFVVEALWLRLGMYSYPDTVRWLTVFHGHYYQFPIYEAATVAAMWTAFSCLRFFPNDKGQTLVERGIERVNCTECRKTLLRLLALVAACNLVFLAYNSTVGFLTAAFGSGWPRDIQKRSYLTNGLCGGRTPFACPQDGLPIQRQGAVSISPDGQLVVPDGARLPAGIPFESE